MRAIAVATAVSALLVAVYLGLGGASYEPTKSADPCVTRDWRNPGGFQEVAEQIALSALDGTACELGVSREEIVLAFAGGDSLETFAREHDVSVNRLEDLLRTGLLRAVDDAERADALNSTVAGILRGVIERVPVDAILDLLEQLPNL
jgi:hypothetical protein